MTDWLISFLRRNFPAERTEKLQAWNIVIAVIGLPIVPFLPTDAGVIVINFVSFYTLGVSALAGLDSARP